MKINYEKVCNKLLQGLPERTLDIIESRFGLKNGEKETLEMIGKRHGLTRERVRQIEKDGLSQIRPRIKDYRNIFKSVEKVLSSFGGIKEEKSFLECLAKKENEKNCLTFILSAADDFKKIPENKDFHSAWAVDNEFFLLAKKVISKTISFLKKENNLFNLNDLFSFLRKTIPQKVDKKAFQSYIEISKKIERNPEGLYGLGHWIEIKPRGIKDKAYLVLKKKKSPLHFKEIASQIELLPFSSPKKIQTTTVHNELIKDERFVLVGRGLYALKEWGYEPGTVKDVILKILKKSKKPLKREEISEKVLKERIVKKNTILLSLSDKNYFLRDEDGKYKVREA